MNRYQNQERYAIRKKKQDRFAVGFKNQDNSVQLSLLLASVSWV
nr:hypothetical protein [uncultured Allomuricauda sp.]